MFKNQRHEEILEILKKEGFAGVCDLSKRLFASQPTIRRDLDILEKQVLGNMIAQRAQQIELFTLVHFKQEAAPALVKYHNHIGTLFDTFGFVKKSIRHLLPVVVSHNRCKRSSLYRFVDIGKPCLAQQMLVALQHKAVLALLVCFL